MNFKDKSGNYVTLRELMTLEETTRYNEYWLKVAENISNEAIDKHIVFLKNGGIKKMVVEHINQLKLVQLLT